MIDGGRYRFHVIDEKSFCLQLPCDQASYLGNEIVVNEPLLPGSIDTSKNDKETIHRAPLAYLLRTAAARRRALHFAFRASHDEQTVEEMVAELSLLETDIQSVIQVLPKRFQFNADSMVLHRGRAALHIYHRDSAKAGLIIKVRQRRVSHALPIAGLLAEGLKAGIIFDPHIGIQANVALEILLFEPRRLGESDPLVNSKATELADAIPPLLTVIRELASRSEVVKQLHIEAVLRLLRFDYTQLLNQADFAAFRSEYRLIGQDAAEYDFRDFRWAKLERVRRGARSATNAVRDEALLKYKVGGESTATIASLSPRLDAMDVNESVARPSTAEPLSSLSANVLCMSESPRADGNYVSQTTQPYWKRGTYRNPSQEFSFDWPWLLEDSGDSVYQTGDPVTFWNQRQRI